MAMMIMRRLVLFGALAMVLGFALRCSSAPQLVVAANRIVLAEMFSNFG